MKLAKRLFSIFTIAIVIAVTVHYFVNHQSSSANPAQLPAPVSLWRSTNGPRDAQTASLVTMNGQLFAAATNGVWTSNDNGQNWQPRNTGLPESLIGVSSLAVIETTLFAATPTGIYRSADAGAHWQAINVGLPSNFPVPQLIAYGSKLYLASYGSGLFVSTDKGNSWTPIHQGLPTNAIASLAVNNSSLWVATLRGIFRSIDGGQNWLRANQGIPVNSFANALSFHGERVFVSVGSNGSISPDILPKDVFAYDEKSGIWQALNEGLGAANVTAFFNLNSELYAGADLGLFRLDVAKASWVPLNNGLRGNVKALTANGNNLFAASGGDILTSSNRGESWTPLNVTFAPVQFATGFATNAAGLYVATPSGVYFRPNDAPFQFWKHASQGITDSQLYDITIQGQSLWTISYNGQAFLSLDNGTSWRSISGGLSGQNLISIAATESAVFVGTTKGGVYNLKTSVTAQTTWSAINQGLIGLTVRDLLAVGSTVYAATDKGIFSTANAGASWSLVSSALAETEKAYEPYSLAADGPTLYAVYGLRNQNLNSTIDLRFQTNPNPVFRSTDNGTNWSRVELRTDVPANFKQVLPTTQGLLALGPGAILLGHSQRMIMPRFGFLITKANHGLLPTKASPMFQSFPNYPPAQCHLG